MKKLIALIIVCAMAVSACQTTPPTSTASPTTETPVIINDHDFDDDDFFDDDFFDDDWDDNWDDDYDDDDFDYDDNDFVYRLFGMNDNFSANLFIYVESNRFVITIQEGVNVIAEYAGVPNVEQDTLLCDDGTIFSFNGTTLANENYGEFEMGMNH